MYVDTTMEGWLPRDILIKTARDPENAALFNYASMAFNNHFYFDGLSLTGEPVPMPKELEGYLSESFSSVETLKSEFLQTAHSMFGPGFVWLVRAKSTYRTNSQRPFHILTTYLAGSPLAGAHNRLQPKDLNTENIVTAGGVSNENFVRSRVQNTVGSFGPWSRAEARSSTSYGGIDVVPVMCVNTWQHAWMFDWTVEGKWQFLQAWWDRIDWNHVQKIAIATSRKPNDALKAVL
jgi:Fe-Mn family superoxide dismutase